MSKASVLFVAHLHYFKGGQPVADYSDVSNKLMGMPEYNR